MLKLGGENIKWLFFLFGTVVFAVLGVLFPNWFKEIASPRPHNQIKLLNECLARHQLAYFSFFFALAIAASFDPAIPWARNVSWTGLGISLGFYGYGLFSATMQDRKIARNHPPCPPKEPNTECTKKLSPKFGLELCGLNIFFALISGTVAIVLALLVR